MLYPEILRTREAAEFLSVTAATLRNWRTKGIGPAAYKLTDAPNGAIRYRRTALETWLNEREQPKLKKRGRPLGSKNKPTMKGLKANLHRVMMKHHLTSSDLQLVMRAFGVKRLRDLQAAQHATFAATLTALGERYKEREADHTCSSGAGT